MLPQEVKEEILTFLWDDKKSLKRCALTARAFVDPAQKLLLAKIALQAPFEFSRKTKQSKFTASRFEKLLKSKPRICQYVEHLEIHDTDGEWLPKDASVLRILPLLVKLKALGVEYNKFSMQRPGMLPASFFTAVLSAIHRPCFEYLSLSEFPKELIKHGQHLAHLSFCEFTSQKLSPMSCSNCTAKLSLDSLNIRYLPDGYQQESFLQTLRNNIEIKKIRRLFASATDSMSSHELLQRIFEDCADTLEELSFSPCAYIFQQSTVDEEPIDYSVLKSIRVLTTGIQMTASEPFNDEFDLGDGGVSFTSPFIWLLNMLRRLGSGNKCLEELNLYVSYEFETDVEELPHWDELGNLLVDRSLFPALQRVNFKIATFQEDFFEEVMEEVEEHTDWMEEASEGRLQHMRLSELSMHRDSSRAISKLPYNVPPPYAVSTSKYLLGN